MIAFVGVCGAGYALAANDDEAAKAHNNYFINKTAGVTFANRRADRQFVVNKAVDGKFTLKGDVGYLYNFTNSWNVGGASLKGVGNSAVGYGASLGYTHRSGFGLSADYLGFNSKGRAGDGNYDASLHTLTFTPSYRIALDANKNWGLKLGLGIGFSLSDITWSAPAGAVNNVASKAIISNKENNSGGKLAGGAARRVNFQTWSLLLRGADGDLTALRDLTLEGSITANPEDIKKGFSKLISNPVVLNALEGGAITLTHSAADLGLTPSQASKLQSLGVTFAMKPQTDTAPPVALGNSANPPVAKAKGDVGFILVPQVALEYDNGYFHGDINVRYIHALKNVTYNGTGNAAGTTYNLAAGPAGIFVGASLGVNF